MIIQIGEFEFDLTRRFEPEHRLTPGEAFALSGLRAERIRGAIVREIERQGQSGTLSGIQLLAIREFAKRLDAEFEFAAPSRPKKHVSTELELLIAEIAEEKSRAHGGSVEDWKAVPSTIDQAQAIIAARRQAAQAELEDL